MNGIHAALIGRLPKDEEPIRYTAQGTAFVSFSVAVADAKRADDERTEWVRCVLWGSLAEEVAPRLTRGARVYLEGRVRLDEWTGKDGQGRTGLKLSAWTCQPIGQLGRKAPGSAGTGGWAAAGSRTAGGGGA